MIKCLMFFMLAFCFYANILVFDQGCELQMIYINMPESQELLKSKCAVASKVKDYIVKNDHIQLANKIEGSSEQHIEALSDVLKTYQNENKFLIEVKKEACVNQYQQLRCFKKKVLEVVRHNLQQNPWLLVVYVYTDYSAKNKDSK